MALTRRFKQTIQARVKRDPAFRKALSQPEYDALRDSLERSEEETFGGQYFDTIMAEVVQLEAAFGIGDLAGFTSIR